MGGSFSHTCKSPMEDVSTTLTSSMCNTASLLRAGGRSACLASLTAAAALSDESSAIVLRKAFLIVPITSAGKLIINSKRLSIGVVRIRDLPNQAVMLEHERLATGNDGEILVVLTAEEGSSLLIGGIEGTAYQHEKGTYLFSGKH